MLNVKLIVIQYNGDEVLIDWLIKEQFSYDCRLLSVKRRAKPRQATLNYIGILLLP